MLWREKTSFVDIGENESKAKALYGRGRRKLTFFYERIGLNIQAVFYQHHLFIMILGFLLGRATILSELVPFALPFLAAIYMLKRETAARAAFALVAGAYIGYHGQFLFVITALIVYILVQKASERLIGKSTKALPYLVFAASLLTRLSFEAVPTFNISNYMLMMATVEAGLSFILTMIFLQSVPLMIASKQRRTLKNEEIISFIILIASVMSGTVGWFIYELSVEHMLARYLVLIFAVIGGAAIGSTVGVVTGLILSLASVANLYQMSLLAFSGLLSGLLKEGKKIGASIGLLIGTLLLGLYGEGGGQIQTTLFESLGAIALLFLTPKRVLTRLSTYIPGTAEYAKEQFQYSRKIRDITAGRMVQFSNLFQSLSRSFQVSKINTNEENEQEIDYFLSNITEKTCQTCFRKKQCWVNNFKETYDSMKKIMQETEKHNRVVDHEFLIRWRKQCTKPDQVIQTIWREHSHYETNKKYKKRMIESHQLVADQLLGVSEVMDSFAKEIQKEKESYCYDEEYLLDALKEIGMNVGHINIFSLEKGKIDIEMSVASKYGECEKVIAPILSDLFKETIIVKEELEQYYPNGHSNVSFSSAKKYVIEIGAAYVAKGGTWVSGDSYAILEMNHEKYAIAISDGMGNGERAHFESNETLELLRKVLQSGIEETVAIKSVNSILSLRTTDEIFSTLDLVMIDLQSAEAKFLKIGSIPSFIKRGGRMKKVEANNLPMGMIQEFEVDVVHEQLKAGDLLIMMSDGIYDAANYVENKELWVKRVIRECETDDPQTMADLILERMIRASEGEIHDDMTVIAIKIKKNTPKWAAIPLYEPAKSVRRYERKRA